MSSQIKALEAFAEDPELVRLESLLKRFNLFEAVGVVRHELRHSDFLAFLLDPSRNHGLGAIFLSEFLQAVRLTTLDLDALNLSHAYVFREWHHIDILVLDDVNHFAVIIENKVDTDEHSGQLSRYYADVRSHFPEHEIIALYLTSDGDAPSDDRYLAISYSQVCQIIEKIIGECHETLDVDVVVVIKHYAQMLRRHIVSDSDVAELCRTIYQKHRQALDLIFEHRPDRQAQIGQYVRSLIHQENQLEPGGGGKTWITFGLHDWKKSPRHEAQRFYVYFEFLNHTDELKISFTIGPGNQADRQKLLLMVQKKGFPGCPSRLAKNHCHASVVSVLRASDYEKTQEEIESLISEKWNEYLHDELPRIAKAVREEEWLWTL